MIEVSTAAVDLLEFDELEALLAHEWAHHLCGHARLHVILQFLGSATFVGGSFVGALEDSFGNELEADRVAVEKLGAQPAALANGLRTLFVAKFVDGTRNGAETQGSVMTDDEKDSVSTWRKWASRARLWLDMYRFDSATSYWYPALRERLEALKRLENPGDDVDRPTGTRTV